MHVEQVQRLSTATFSEAIATQHWVKAPGPVGELRVPGFTGIGRVHVQFTPGPNHWPVGLGMGSGQPGGRGQTGGAWMLGLFGFGGQLGGAWPWFAHGATAQHAPQPKGRHDPQPPQGPQQLPQPQGAVRGPHGPHGPQQGPQPPQQPPQQGPQPPQHGPQETPQGPHGPQPNGLGQPQQGTQPGPRQH